MGFKNLSDYELQTIQGGSNTVYEKFKNKFWTLEGAGVGAYTKLQGQLMVANAKAARGQKP